jgi:hypothetical protein
MRDRARLKVAALGLAGAALLLVGSGGSLAAHDRDDDHDRDDKVTFALWGDMPYSDADAAKIPALIADINAAHVDFAVFDGDIKSGSSRCDDTQFEAAIARFNTFRMPSVYVPGDNEWTDCHRINNGGFNALEREAFMRQTMFADEKSFGMRPMRLSHQGPLGGEYSENTRWTRGGVVFVTLNIPGSNNNKIHLHEPNIPDDCLSSKSVRTEADCAADNAEYQARDAANIQWLRDSFALAKSRGLRGLMVIYQAEPGFDLPETETFNERAQPAFDGYTNFLNAATDEARAFDGQVVLVNGDIHFFKLDKPLVDQAHLVPNLTRLETFGSPNVHWVKVTIDPHSRSLFRFEPMIVPGN